MSTLPPGASQPDLESFLAESPLNRPSIFAFMQRLARDLTPGTRVLDAGAGDAPYAVLFTDCRYVTNDWNQSQHAGAKSADVLAPVDRLPLDDASFDVVICTEVLEHVSDPAAAIREFHRILDVNGELWLTVPFVWELHEEPHDFFRYTRHGLWSLLERAGFESIEIEPIGGYFSTLAQLLRNCGPITGLSSGPFVARAATRLLGRVAPVLRRLEPLDTRGVLPLEYTCRARRAPPQSA